MLPARRDRRHRRLPPPCAPGAAPPPGAPPGLPRAGRVLLVVGLAWGLGLAGGAACASDPQAAAVDASGARDVHAPDGGLELPAIGPDASPADASPADASREDRSVADAPGPSDAPGGDGPSPCDCAEPDAAPADVDAAGGGDGAVSDGSDGLEGDADASPGPGACPEPPSTLPDVTPEGAGRWWVLGPVGTTGEGALLPRLVRVYLPAGYDDDPEARFPVLYMHDGQNLFQDADAAFGVEWRVDETIDALTASGDIEPHIVVGVDNTAERLDDYTPSFDPDYGAGGKGDAYVDFLADVVKPLIDLHFRTRCGRADTALVGSSLGGLISLHAATRRPETFGLVGCVSPSLWWAGGQELDTWASFAGPMPARIWFDAGSAEGGEETAGGGMMIDGIRAARAVALEHGLTPGDTLGYLEDPGALHNEAAWAARLDSVFRFLFAAARPAESPVTAARLAVFGPYLVAGGPAGAPGEGEPSQTSLAVEVTRAGVRETLLHAGVPLASLDPAVAAVSSDGVVSAVSAGVTAVEADLGAFHPSAPVVVADEAHAAVTFLVDTPPGSEGVAVVGGPEALGAWDGTGLPMRWLRAHQFRATALLTPGQPFEYKYTRGDWGTVEKGPGGVEVANRAAIATTGVRLEDEVSTWADWP